MATGEIQIRRGMMSVQNWTSVKENVETTADSRYGHVACCLMDYCSQYPHHSH